MVEVEPGQSAKCGNCGDRVRAPRPGVPTDRPPPPGPKPEGGPVPAPTAPPAAGVPAGTYLAPTVAEPAGAVTRAASIVAFVFGLLFFIPFVTQVLALCTGVYAIARPRRPNERVVLAWIGMAVALVALPGWLYVGKLFLTAARTATFTMPPPYRPIQEESWEMASALEEQMKRIHRGASAYRRDFGEWPPDVDVLVGRSLPRGFKMPGRLTYRPVPPSEQRSYSWVLIVSDEVRAGPDGELLGRPHRLVCRLGGKVELLPAPEVSALLNSQRTDITPAEPTKPTTGGGG